MTSTVTCIEVNIINFSDVRMPIIFALEMASLNIRKFMPVCAIMDNTIKTRTF